MHIEAYSKNLYEKICSHQKITSRNSETEAQQRLKSTDISSAFPLSLSAELVNLTNHFFNIYILFPRGCFSCNVMILSRDFKAITRIDLDLLASFSSFPTLTITLWFNGLSRSNWIYFVNVTLFFLRAESQDPNPDRNGH